MGAQLRKPVSASNPDRVTGVSSAGRIPLTSKLASVCLVLVLLGASAFAIWSSQVTSEAARAAVLASRLSGHFADAARAATTEEALERQYRLTPGPGLRAKFNVAAGQLRSALASVGSLDATDADKVLAQKVLATHERYVEAVDRVFNAVDKGDAPAARKIETEEDALFDAMVATLNPADDAHHQESLDNLASLQEVEVMSSWLTPVVFLAGLLLASLMISIIRARQRLLDTERHRALHDSTHDALTGLPNRTLLFDRLEQALQAGKRAGRTAGLLLIDLDRFKEVNDTFGHHYGDMLLAQIGPRLRSALREGDTVARLGGDEFAVLLPDIADLSAAMGVAAKVRAALETPFIVEGVALDVEASVGVVISGDHGTDPTTLLQRADIAMYIAKTQSTGVFAYDPNVDRHSPVKLALLGELRAALKLGQLVVQYQPKVSISDGEVIGAEALVRWQHPQRGLIYPDAFIPLAEHTGLIGPLTTYVLDAALTQARVWMDAGRPLIVAVNLSTRNLLDEDLPGQVADLLAAHAVPAELLKLEVTESALMSEPDKAARLLNALAAFGVQISIDDFGAGYTSLGQLKNLPVAELKIDKSFILNMSNDPTCAVIVHSIVDLGHSLGLTIVAEGVETAAILTDLRAVGCDVAQGYYLSRPVPAVEFDYWLCYRPELDQSTRMTGPLPPAALSLLRTPGLVNLGGSQDLETQK